MRLATYKIAILLMAAGLVEGCSQWSSSALSATASPTASFVSAEVLPTQAPNELIRMAGVGGPYTSAPFQISDEVTIRASWEQSSTGEFSFGVAGPDGQQDVTMDSLVAFELVVGPSNGSGEHTLAPGGYVVKVIAADGPWLIWIETISTQ